MFWGFFIWILLDLVISHFFPVVTFLLENLSNGYQAFKSYIPYFTVTPLYNHFKCQSKCLCLFLFLLPLNTALLDLPVQPSASEVLGFGQTANASPSGLPFRFYEQSRRAPNDPTANRSVFASVDKVPGIIHVTRLWCNN